MDGAKEGETVPSNEGGITESNTPQTGPMDVTMEILSRRGREGAEKFTRAMERFSVLSTEMITLLMGLSQEINRSAEELDAVQSAVELKKRELETIRDAEQLARELELQIEILLNQKADLERSVIDQRSAWEEEKAQRAREDDEWTNARRGEQIKARQELEEELRVIRDRNQEAQNAREQNLADRDLILQRKEAEWNRLIQDLDQFLSKLSGRSFPYAAKSESSVEETTVSPGSTKTGSALPGNFQGSGWQTPEIESELSPEEAMMWENIWREGRLNSEDRNYLLAQNAGERKTPPLVSRDVHVLQNRKLEDADDESAVKRENTPLKFAPKNPNNHL